MNFINITIGGVVSSVGLGAAMVIGDASYGDFGLNVAQAVGGSTFVTGTLTALNGAESASNEIINTTQEFLGSLSNEQLVEFDNKLSEKEEDLIKIGDKIYKLEGLDDEISETEERLITIGDKTYKLEGLDNEISETEENIITIGDKTYKLEEVESNKQEKQKTYEKKKLL